MGKKYKIIHVVPYGDRWELRPGHVNSEAVRRFKNFPLAKWRARQLADEIQIWEAIPEKEPVKEKYTRKYGEASRANYSRTWKPEPDTLDDTDD